MRHPFAVLAFASLPTLLMAHPGHTHHVMGTVQEVDAHRIEVKDMDGKLVPCLIKPATKFMREDAYLAIPGIKVGERIMIDCEEKKDGMIALKVRLGKAE